MKKLFVTAFLLQAIIICVSFSDSQPASVNWQSLNDSLEKDRAKYIALINDQIKGKEQAAVDSVFANLKVLGGFPAENLVFAMNAWSRGLGVSCGHCHNTSDFASDEKEKKDIARQMVEMGNMIGDKLKSIKGLSTRPVVNCITCHRGEIKPAFRMPVN